MWLRQLNGRWIRARVSILRNSNFVSYANSKLPLSTCGLYYRGTQASTLSTQPVFSSIHAAHFSFYLMFFHTFLRYPTFLFSLASGIAWNYCPTGITHGINVVVQLTADPLSQIYWRINATFLTLFFFFSFNYTSFKNNKNILRIIILYEIII